MYIMRNAVHPDVEGGAHVQDVGRVHGALGAPQLGADHLSDDNIIY